MSNEDPKLAAALRIQSPGEIWQPREAKASNTTASGSDQNGGFARATMLDGKVIREETGKIGRTSTQEIAAAQNIANMTPYDYAVDPKTGCRVGPYELTEECIVYMHGASLTVAQARQVGWLSPTRDLNAQVREDGSREDAINNPYTESPPKAEVHPDLKVDLLADETLDRDYSNLVDNTGGVEQQQAIQQIVESGQIDERTLGTLATQLRIEPEQLQARVAPLMQAFEKQARAVMSEGGLDSNAVVAWAQQNHPDKLRLAMGRHASMRNASGYADLRQSYLETLADHSPELALRADLGTGISQFRDGKGRIIVRLAGGETMEWGTALKAFGIRK